MAEPTMEDTMKQAKIMPCGMCSPWGLSAGVHRNTKVYMAPSNSACIAPSMPIFGSAQMRASAWVNCAQTPSLPVLCCSYPQCTLRCPLGSSFAHVPATMPGGGLRSTRASVGWCEHSIIAWHPQNLQAQHV